MSRVAKTPIFIPSGVDVTLTGQDIFIKGKNGELAHNIHKTLNVQMIDNQLTFSLRGTHTASWALAGTTRALLNNMVIGVTKGFSKTLQLVGVGYRAAVKDNVLYLSLGFSHPIEHKLSAGITAECPSQTEIVLKGTDKQAVGQVAANLRAYRHPEPYKGKGIRYSDEIVHIKEAKKK